MTWNKWPPSLAVLRELDDADLVKLYDGERAELDFHLREIIEELHRRAEARKTDSIRSMTRAMAAMTGIILLATLLNVALVASSL